MGGGGEGDGRHGPLRGYVEKKAAAGQTAKKVLVLGADGPPTDVEEEPSSDSELDELAQLLDFGLGWDASNDSVQLPEQSADVAGADLGWRDSVCADSSDTDDEPGSVLAAILDGSSVSGRSGADEIDDRLAEEAGLVADGLVRYDDQAVLEVGGEESLGAGAGAGTEAGTEAAQGGLVATPAPWLDALADRVRNLCIVCGEGTSFVLHVGGEGRLSQVLRPND